MPERTLRPETERDDRPSDSGEELLDGFERVIQLRARRGPRREANTAIPTEICQLSDESRIVVHQDPRSAAADRFKMMHIRLKELQAANNLKTILITSALPGDGKSTVALNLATVLAEKGRYPVLLLEADVYRPVLSKRLGVRPWGGLTQCYLRGTEPARAIRRIEPLGFYFLPAGEPARDADRPLQSSFVISMMNSLSAYEFGWILIDAPPTTPVADVLVLKAQADATLLVARAGATPVESIEDSIRNLGREQVIGLVLNGVEGINRAYSRYYGYSAEEPVGRWERLKRFARGIVAGKSPERTASDGSQSRHDSSQRRR